jgi:hypothetical protein
VSSSGPSPSSAPSSFNCLHHRNPLLDRDLFRRRSFTGASTVATLFSIAFGAFLLSLVLWDQNVWHWSTLQTGLAIAPGPFVVLPTALLIVQRLIVRVGPGAVIAIGTSLFTAGTLWFALFADAKPGYFADIFPGLVTAGVGVGLALTTIMASATSELPPENLASTITGGLAHVTRAMMPAFRGTLIVHRR